MYKNWNVGTAAASRRLEIVISTEVWNLMRQNLFVSKDLIDEEHSLLVLFFPPSLFKSLTANSLGTDFQTMEAVMVIVYTN